MLEIEPVSKYRKQAYSKLLREKSRKLQEIGGIPFSEGYKLPELQRMTAQENQLPYQERQFEDARLTKFIYEQLNLIRLIMNFLGLTSILLSFIVSLTDFKNMENDFVLSLQTVMSVFLVVLVSLKYWKGVELRKRQLVREKKTNRYVSWAKTVYFQSLLLLVHPNLLCAGVVMQFQEPVFGTITPIQLNNLLEIIMLSRVYLLFAAIINSSIYCTPRANRMCRIYNTKYEYNFGIKSVFNAYPLHSLLILFVSLVLVLSLMLKLAEQNNPEFSNIGNAIWCIIITMSTVGYGDYYPTSYVGRIIAFISAICGIIISSLLILTLSEYLAMNSREAKSHITLRRLELRSILEQYAEETIIATSSLGLGGEGALEQLKKKTERVKLTMRRLKNMVDTDNINEEINNMFQSLYANMMQIYIQQKQYAEDLQTLKEREGQRIQEINFTFAGEIEDIIKGS